MLVDVMVVLLSFEVADLLLIPWELRRLVKVSRCS